MCWDAVGWIAMVHCWSKWRAVVNVVLNLQVA